jgi:outer membrane protein W
MLDFIPGNAAAPLGSCGGRRTCPEQGESMKTIAMTAAALAFAGALATPAFAQTAEGDFSTKPVLAPRRAFEIGVDTGYTQGFGSIYKGRAVGEVARAGMGVGLGLGARITPNFSLGVNGQLQGFNADPTLPKGMMVRGAAAGIEATFHAAPYQRVDPWVTVGTGYRMLMEVPEGNTPNTLTHGLELGKLQIGVDLRASDSVAISPVLGADMNMFMWRNEAGAGMNQVADKRLNTFVFAGVKGRFDLGGTREAKPERVIEQQTGSR